MPFDVHPVVLTNVQKDLGSHVEVVLETPRGDPWTFAFAHKKILAERVDKYDLFIYSEDDTLIIARNIDSFLACSEVLPSNQIAGFLRSEEGADNTKYLSTISSYYHWEPSSVVSRGPYTFAFFTNEHSACYMLTRDQLTRAISSGGYLVRPHQEKYDLLVSAATDPYTQCGFKKMVCISQLKDFLLPHLPNRYVGQLGLEETEAFRQVEALMAIGKNERKPFTLLDRSSYLENPRWSKSYYESVRSDLMEAVPAKSSHILSYGCGWGALEEELIRRGARVTALPLDSVIAATTEAKGIPTVYGNADEVFDQPSSGKFDCILVSNLLHLYAEPGILLRKLSAFLVSGGSVVALVPNLNYLPVLARRIARRPGFKELGHFDRSGVSLSSLWSVQRWFEQGGLKIDLWTSVAAPRFKKFEKLPIGTLRSFLAEEFVVRAVKR